MHIDTFINNRNLQILIQKVTLSVIDNDLVSTKQLKVKQNDRWKQYLYNGKCFTSNISSIRKYGIVNVITFVPPYKSSPGNFVINNAIIIISVSAISSL